MDDCVIIVVILSLYHVLLFWMSLSGVMAVSGTNVNLVGITTINMCSLTAINSHLTGQICDIGVIELKQVFVRERADFIFIFSTVVRDSYS